MPGTSRHHWGTDIHLNAFTNEFFENGEGLKIYTWLFAHAREYGFCQPYTQKGTDRITGYNEEKWHWSWMPVSERLTELARTELKNEMIGGFLGYEAATRNVTPAWKAHKKGAFFGNPCYTQIHPTCIPVSGDHQSNLTLMSESLRNDGRIWVPKKKDDPRKAHDIPEDERDYYLERRYPAFGNLVPRDVASRAAKERCDAGYGVGASKMAVYLDFAANTERYGKIEANKLGLQNPSKDEIIRLGKEVVKEKYGNLFDMYKQITGEDPYEVPMRIYPAVHYTMGGLWVDYNLMTTVPGLYALGEANFSDHVR